MSLYSQGLAVQCRNPFLSHRIGVSVGALEGSSGIMGTGVFSDIPGAIVEINRQISAMEIEMEAQLGDANLRAWYQTVWLPWLAAWHNWSSEHSHWYHNMFLSAWHEANDWAEQLKNLHASAITAGFSFQGPAPSGASKDALQKAGAGILDEIWSMVKIIVYAGAIIIGVVLVSRFV